MHGPDQSRGGAYRRRIRLRSVDVGEVGADLEDDFHRFRVSLHHDGHYITHTYGEALRYPWTTCAEAGEPLAELIGAPLTPRATALADHADPHHNCTHLFDLAGLAVTHAAGDRHLRQYDAVVPDRDERGRTKATLARDGDLVLTWDVEAHTIAAPAMFEGVTLRGGFLKWVDAHLDPETAEAASILRRAVEISMGRGIPFDQFRAAADVGEFMLGSCYTFQAGTAEAALRVKGTVRDFTDHPHDLLDDEPGLRPQ